ncbi:MAG: ABC transporter ATP-binding protein/permease [Treponema sp.]|jgi:ABC-type multidrug transport system fused ATPase/permease subunit|nr:ABC transporter ATP-binding protein/permease [Treponema sp.]
MEIDYETLLDKQILEKRELALKVIEQGRFNNLTRDFRAFVSNIIILGGIVYIISGIEFWILLIVLAIVVINTLSTTTWKEGERVIFTESVPVNRKITYFLSINADSASGKEIRIYSMLRRLSEIFDDLLMALEKYLKRAQGFSCRAGLIYYTTNFFLNMVIYGFMGYKLLVKNLITVGDFSLSLSAINNFNNAVQDVIRSYINISNNGQYLKDYFDYMEMESRYNKGDRDLAIDSAGELIFVFENVNFRYPYQDAMSVKNINLRISSKERLSIVGENGAGKTTLIKLLMRLFEPTEGRITLNGVDIKEMDYRNYLGLFSTVFQDFRLFAFRIADNITSLQGEGEAPIGQVKLRDCLVKAGISEKIDSLDKGLDTYLYKLYEEDGIELSGGESQKLAIARALYKDAPVVVLDEPTAALDPRAEYEIYTRFFEMVHNKTSVFITHRLSSTRFCDRIIVLKNGEIVETGSHDELLARKGYYAELFNMQAQFYTGTENCAGESSI